MTEHLAFGSLTIAFDDRVLRPREWTAAQSDWAATLMATAPAGAVLELCAGAGHMVILEQKDRVNTALEELFAAAAAGRTSRVS